jgi:hypothetical protein
MKQGFATGDDDPRFSTGESTEGNATEKTSAKVSCETLALGQPSPGTAHF